jgi:N6-L-threonylcarbamoyladenine synthase
MVKILAFESSCDDTAVAIVDESGQILANEIFSPTRIHAVFGGVVPEIGSRSHIEQIIHVTRLALAHAQITLGEIDAVAATFAPGLLGPLLVGAQFAKGLAKALNKPLIAVHHIEGHILSGYLEPTFPKPPFIALVVSGGHTALYQCLPGYQYVTLGETLDDAAGEAFDKIGRTLGFSYPCGQAMDDVANTGDPHRFKWSPPMHKKGHLNFSFSGLKTQSLNMIKAHGPMDPKTLADFCAGLRETIARALVDKTILASRTHEHQPVVLGGGVAANSRLRELLKTEASAQGISVYMSPRELCMDNAVMIARAALQKYTQGQFASLGQEVMARLPIEQKNMLDAKN